MVQWLGLLAFTAGGAQVPSLIRELQIPQAELCCGGGEREDKSSAEYFVHC